MKAFKIYVGFDERESVVYHTFAQSVIENTSVVVNFIPLIKDVIGKSVGTRTDGSNDFIYTRFLVPELQNFEGWVLYVDGDMIVQRDIAEIFSLADDKYAVMVVKHDYKTKQTKKYFGNKNEDYPRKNWSSVVLWNCSHPKNRVLTTKFVSQKDGTFLHRFSWLSESDIGGLPIEWNWLSVEYPVNVDAYNIHYTLGAPCLGDYRDTDMAEIWLKYHKNMNRGFDVL